jgi:hypothetical protein
MTHEYDEEMQKVQGGHPHSTTAGTSSRSASSGSPTQLPAWTQGADSGVHEGERYVRKWLDENVEKLGILSLTLSQLVQCVLDSVPGAMKLSRIQIESIICEWATDHAVTILQTVPPPSAHRSIAADKSGEKGEKKRGIGSK